MENQFQSLLKGIQLALHDSTISLINILIMLGVYHDVYYLYTLPRSNIKLDSLKFG